MAEAPPCTPSSWSDIPLDIAGLVLRLLPAHADLARFAAVCPKWRAAAWRAAAWRFAAWQFCLLPPLPGIALSDGSFYSLPRGERFLFPDYGGRWRYHSTCGNWLVFSRDDGFFLVDPFSNATMKLPGVPSVRRDDESDVASDGEELVMHNLIVCSPHLVAAVVGFHDFGENQIAVCRPGASSWSVVRAHDPFMRFCGMAFHQGKLYVLDFKNNLHAVDISVDHRGDPCVSRIRLVIEAEEAMLTDDPRSKGDDRILTMLYLVESHGALLMARRNIWCRRTSMYSRTFVVPTNSEFEVFEADFGPSRWKVTTVGDDQVLFLARWYSRAVSVSKYGMPGNRIFFWDDDLYHNSWSFYHDRESFSCSAYDMGDRTVSSPLPTISWNHGMAPRAWGEFISWERGLVPLTWLFSRD